MILTLFLDDYTIPVGAIIYITTFLVHRSKDYWSHPKQFYPEHFLKENISSRPKFSFLPFMAGPRGCPGNIIKGNLLSVT